MTARRNIARASLRHALHLTRILWACGHEAPWLPRVRTRRTDLRLMARATRRGWVHMVRDATGPAGFIARDGTTIHALYVHPRAARRGLGRALLADAKSNAPRLELWVAEANTAALAFYRAQGFKEAGRGTGLGNDENLPDIHMVWPHTGAPGHE